MCELLRRNSIFFFFVHEQLGIIQTEIKQGDHLTWYEHLQRKPVVGLRLGEKIIINSEKR